MDIELPDGTVVQGIPDGMSKAAITNKLVASGYGGSLSSKADRAMADPTRDMGAVERVRAGAGKAFSDLWRGGQQLVGSDAPTMPGLVTGDARGPLQREIDDSKRLDAPLMRTPAGVAGNIAGGMAIAGAALPIPGANTLAGAGLLGATQGLLQPVETGGSRALNTAVGAGGGVVGQAVGNKIASAASSAIANRSAQKGQNAVRDATLTAGRDAGYVLPPSAVEPGFLTNRLESIAGKAALGQQASHQNQKVTNELARDALGLPKNQAVSLSALEAIRKTEGRAYADVAALSRNAADALEELKTARFDATAHFKHWQKSGDPAALAKARQAEADKGLWETFLENEAIAAGKPNLVPAMREARVRIAKTHDVERALNTSTGNVDAKVLARAVDAGKPLTGQLETAGRFADAFPRYMQHDAPAAGVSALEGAFAPLMAGIGYGATGNPLGLAAAAIPLLRPPVRAGILSGPGQAMLSGVPSYGPGMLNPLLSGQLTAPVSGLLATQGALSAR